jgi:hypothetical protein
MSVEIEMVNEGHFARERRNYLVRLVQYCWALVVPRVSHGTKEVSETYESGSIDTWIIRTSHKRLTIRREKDRHGPAATSADELRRRHVQRIDVGSLFTVNLYGDEVVVEQGGNVWIFE